MEKERLQDPKTEKERLQDLKNGEGTTPGPQIDKERL